MLWSKRLFFTLLICALSVVNAQIPPWVAKKLATINVLDLINEPKTVTINIPQGGRAVAGSRRGPLSQRGPFGDHHKAGASTVEETYSSGSPQQPRALTSFTIAQAGTHCSPMVKQIDSPPGDEPGTFFYPACVDLHRCGGCCLMPGHSCQPSQGGVQDVALTMAKFKLDDFQNTVFVGMKPVVFKNHTSCNCGCVIESHHCNPNIHDYQANECLCRCKNQNDFLNCFGGNIFWDNDKCQCRCAEVKMCKQFEYFDGKSCACELRRNFINIRRKEK